MNRQQAKKYMIEKIEEIERERLAANMAIDATKQKKETVENIIKALKGVQFDDEN